MGMLTQMNIDVTPALKNIPFLKDVPARAMKAAGKEARWFSLSAGGALFKTGEPADCIYFVLSGSLGAFRESPDGQDEFIGHIRTGEPVGEMALFLGGLDLDGDGEPEDAPHTGSVYAIRDSEVIAITRKGWQRMVKAEPVDKARHAHGDDGAGGLALHHLHRPLTRAVPGGEEEFCPRGLFEEGAQLGRHAAQPERKGDQYVIGRIDLLALGEDRLGRRAGKLLRRLHKREAELCNVDPRDVMFLFRRAFGIGVAQCMYKTARRRVRVAVNDTDSGHVALLVGTCP
jgi:hypothetical protein